MTDIKLSGMTIENVVDYVKKYLIDNFDLIILDEDQNCVTRRLIRADAYMSYTSLNHFKVLNAMLDNIASPAELKVTVRTKGNKHRDNDNISPYKALCDRLACILEKKKHDYGSSFHDLYSEYGITSAAIRLEDKLNRIKSIIKKGFTEVEDEALEDTLMDLAGYAILTLAEMEDKKDG